MDDFGNSLAIYWDTSKSPCCQTWQLWHFYGMVGPGGCIHLSCAEFCDPRLNVI